MNSDRLDRALAIMTYLARHHEGRTVKQISSDLELPMSSSHDLLQAMADIGAVQVGSGRLYALGPRAVTVALTVVDSLSLRTIARPHLAALCAAIHENIYIGVRNGDTVVYVDRVEATQELSVVMQLGSARPLHASSVGKLITAFNPDLEQKVFSASTLYPYTPFTKVNREELRSEYARIRSLRYSISDGESVEGIVGLSTPIWDHTGAVSAAIHVSAPKGRITEDRRPFVINEMQEASRDISTDLGAAPGIVVSMA
jgi:DNA-binding IclR family transcriptional regulator